MENNLQVTNEEIIQFSLANLEECVQDYYSAQKRAFVSEEERLRLDKDVTVAFSLVYSAKAPPFEITSTVISGTPKELRPSHLERFAKGFGLSEKEVESIKILFDMK
ncbi:MAG: hypothetical protein AAB875_00175 [Patescibacteria group bacterium]